MPAQRTIRLGLAIVASAGSLALSWPFWRDYSYWAESPALWLIYFAVGFVLAVYVFVVFFRSLRTLFEHDALTRRSDDEEVRP
ncbi:MAG: hypothetical protein WBA66_04240 [Xanthobacteraceae bacterium]